MQIHERIRNERVKAGLTEEQLAEKIGVKRSTYQYWETKTPNVEKVKQVAKALGLPENYFFVNINPRHDEIFGNADLVYKSTDKEQIVFVEAKSLSASYERIIEEKEARRRDAEAWAQKMEAHYNDMKNALEKAQTTINEVLKPMKEQTQEILINSKEVRENTMDGIIEMQSEHRAIMDTLDQIAKQPIGTTVGKADILEGASQDLRSKSRMKKSAHKQSKAD
jgi:transcriptional regulator with XRE-family HTH domain